MNKYNMSGFWIQNHKPNKEETKFQGDFFSEMGYSGCFFHCCTGLLIEYLSEDWFKAFGEALNVMKENGNCLWIYDEDTWPSGNAGGRVASVEENRAKCIKIEFVPIGDRPNKCDNEFLCAYSLKGRKFIPARDDFDTNEIDFSPEIQDFEIISEKQAFENTQCERLVVRSEYGGKTLWWGNNSYANLLEEKAVDTFLKETHEKYKKYFAHEFGKSIPGVFTDEPQLMTGYNCIAYWDNLPDAYMEKYGHSFWEDLPYMFFNHSKAIDARLNINRIILERFVENYDKKLYDWCESNNLFLTGHYNMEDHFLGQINNQYGSIMAHYKYNHIPGIDHLGKQVEGIVRNENDTFLACVQVTSVANQLGKNKILNEIWGVVGHTCSLNDFKWIGDHDVALGINFLVPHFASYSINGRRKRMYPPVFNYQEPFFKYFKPLVSHFNNLTQILSQGTGKADILVINTIESAIAVNKRSFQTMNMDKDSWTYHQNLPSDINKEDYTNVQKIDRDFRKAVHGIFELGYNCEIGEEGYIEDIGSVEGNEFIIGNRKYKVLVLPPCVTLRKSTVSKIKEFVCNGGKLVVLGKCFVEEINSLENVIFCPNSKKQLQHNIDKIYKTDYLLRDKNFSPMEKTLINVRDCKDESYYFITNRDKFFIKEYLFETKYKYIYEIDSLNLKKYKCKTFDLGNKRRCYLSLDKSDSVLLLGSNSPYNCEHKNIFSPDEIIELINPKVTLLHENICVCDEVVYSFDNGRTWSEKTEICNARQKIGEYFNLNDAFESQPYRWVDTTTKGLVKIRYFVNSHINCDCKILFENLNNGYVSLNGNKLDFNNNIQKIDHTFKLAQCKIEKGLNVVEHVFEIGCKSEIESVYILGNFSCNIINNKPEIDTYKPIGFGSVVNQGLPFYCHELKYSFKVNLKKKNTLLNLKNLVANGYKLSVNDNLIFSFKDTVDISDYLIDGENKIDIFTVFSLQNAFGALHNKDGEDTLYLRWISFDKEELKVHNYTLYDYGLGGVELLIHNPKE